MEQTEVQPISSSVIKNGITPVKQVKDEYDEPLIYFAFGNICFATATFLMGLINFYHYNPLFLTIFGFWFPGWGQIITAIKAYQCKYYIDGNIYFFFAINWFVNFCYDLFPIWGWMEPLNHTEYGIHNLERYHKGVNLAIWAYDMDTAMYLISIYPDEQNPAKNVYSIYISPIDGTVIRISYSKEILGAIPKLRETF